MDNNKDNDDKDNNAKSSSDDVDDNEIVTAEEDEAFAKTRNANLGVEMEGTTMMTVQARTPRKKQRASDGGGGGDDGDDEEVEIMQVRRRTNSNRNSKDGMNPTKRTNSGTSANNDSSDDDDMMMVRVTRRTKNTPSNASSDIANEKSRMRTTTSGNQGGSGQQEEDEILAKSRGREGAEMIKNDSSTEGNMMTVTKRTPSATSNRREEDEILAKSRGREGAEMLKNDSAADATMMRVTKRTPMTTSNQHEEDEILAKSRARDGAGMLKNDSSVDANVMRVTRRTPGASNQKEEDQILAKSRARDGAEMLKNDSSAEANNMMVTRRAPTASPGQQEGDEILAKSRARDGSEMLKNGSSAEANMMVTRRAPTATPHQNEEDEILAKARARDGAEMLPSKTNAKMQVGSSELDANDQANTMWVMRVAPTVTSSSIADEKSRMRTSRSGGSSTSLVRGSFGDDGNVNTNPATEADREVVDTSDKTKDSDEGGNVDTNPAMAVDNGVEATAEAVVRSTRPPSPLPEIEPGAYAITRLGNNDDDDDDDLVGDGGEGNMGVAPPEAAVTGAVAVAGTATADETKLLDAELVDEEAQEQRFREQMLKEAVQAEIYEGAEEGNRNNKARYAIVCLLVVALALLLGLLLRPNKDDGAEVVPLTDYEFLLETLSEISSTDLILQDNETAQATAFQWLFNATDNYTLSLLQQARNTTSSDAIELQQRYIMAVLYFMTNGTGWISEYNFLSNVSVCDWPSNRDDWTEEEVERETSPGVHCDEEGRITRIFLGKNGMYGPIPNELGQLQSLQYLNLFGNSLTGTIPESIGSLGGTLGKLFLQKNALNGTIPSSLEQLNRLSVLSLSNQELTGTIPSNLFKILTLEWVFLEGNSLNGTIPEVASRIGIESFDLASNQLTGTIPDNVYSWQKIEKFSVWGNQLSGTLSSKMSTWTSLAELFLDSNVLSGPIPSEIGTLRNLQSLFLNLNQFTATLPREIVNLSKLQFFALQYNALLSGTLPDGLDSLLPSLSYFALFATNITGDVGSSICASEHVIPNFFADCLPPEAEAQLDPETNNTTAVVTPSAKVACDCCTVCCNTMACAPNVPQICTLDAANYVNAYGPTRNSTCECNELEKSSEEVVLLLVDAEEAIENPITDLEPPIVGLTCTETCESCNEDRTVCGRTVAFGWGYNTHASRTTYQVSYQYTNGRDELLTFVFHQETDFLASYSFFIDGIQCNSMAFNKCPDGTQAWFLDCSNVVTGGGEDSSGIGDGSGILDTCEIESRGGVLEALTFAFEQSSGGCPPPLSRQFFCEVTGACV